MASVPNTPAKVGAPSVVSAPNMTSEENIPAVKFCGLSQLADCAAVNACAPDYVGFVFWPQSKRAVTVEEARVLRQELDSTVTTVGVFVDAPLQQIVDLYSAGIISVAQLHGEEDPAYMRALREAAPGLTIWKAHIIADEQDVQAAQDSEADLVLLDAGKGEGAAFEWKLLKGLTRAFALAGGLDAQAVRRYYVCHEQEGLPLPVLFDVSSAIESDTRAADGRPHKDEEKMRAFKHAVKEGKRG